MDPLFLMWFRHKLALIALDGGDSRHQLFHDNVQVSHLFLRGWLFGERHQHDDH
jgi:hypothetical protein